MLGPPHLTGWMEEEVRLLHATPHLPTLLFLLGVQGNTAPPRRQHVPASLAASHGPGAVSGSKGTSREVTGRKPTILELPLAPVFLADLLGCRSEGSSFSSHHGP